MQEVAIYLFCTLELTSFSSFVGVIGYFSNPYFNSALVQRLNQFKKNNSSYSLGDDTIIAIMLPRTLEDDYIAFARLILCKFLFYSDPLFPKHFFCVSLVGTTTTRFDESCNLMTIIFPGVHRPSLASSRTRRSYPWMVLHSGNASELDTQSESKFFVFRCGGGGCSLSLLLRGEEERETKGE